MALQSNVLEFIVSGSLDGTTANPVFQRANATSPRPDPPGDDPENIYQFEVENLGIIDLTFPAEDRRSDGPVTKGNRYIPWLLIDTGGVIAPAGAGVDVAAFRPGSTTPIVQKEVVDLEGDPGIYLRRCIFVPHGSSLRLGPGIVAAAGTPIIVRFAVLLPTTRAEEELIVRACCCLRDTTPTVPTTCIDPPNPNAITPPTLSNGVTPIAVTIDGTNFQDGDVVSIPGLVVGSTTFVSDTELKTTVVPEDTGTFNVLVSRPGEDNCTGTLVDGFTVT